MPVTPPTCKTCGVQEFRHTCKGAIKDKAKPAEKPKKKGKRA